MLAMLAANGGGLNRVDFQKLLFIFTQRCEQVPSYEFVPFKKGSYSFTSIADKVRLTKKGFLTEGEDWQLTESGAKAARVPSEVSSKLKLFCERHKEIRGDSLIACSYREYPYWATRSRIAKTILRGDDAALTAIERVRPIRSTAKLCSIGYEGRSLEGYLNALLKAGVSVLCDVRKNPLSRKFGFSKKMLSHVCSELNIRYEHLPQLGILSEDRQKLYDLADYQVLFRKYEQTVLVNELEALDQIAAWVKADECVALTCYERLPEYCHRTRVAQALEKLIGTKTADL